MNSLESPAMGPDTEKGEILSTWKEIAAYLNSGVRTCLRWEKENGLPVHRQEGAPRSRIFAYTGELDAWFKSRLSNGSIHNEIEPAPISRRRTWLLLASLGVAGMAVAAFLMLRPAAGVRRRPPETGVPHSSGSFDLHPTDFVETEFSASGRLRVWRTTKPRDAFESWRIEPVRHTTFAIGNLDKDEYLEIVAPGHCREFEKPGEMITSKIRFFFNAYKAGYWDWWKTTYYDKSQCVIEKDNYEFTETVIADADNLPGNEIVLLTAHALSIFRYDEKADEIRLVCSLKAFISNVNTLMRSVAVADINNDGQNEILATADEGEEGAITPGKGWLFVLRWQGDQPVVSRVEALPGDTSARALKIGEIVPGGSKQAIIACYRSAKTARFGYVVGWTFDRGFVFEKLIDEVSEGPSGGIFIAVGDLSSQPGDEILVARNDPPEILSFSWGGTGLVQGPKYSLDQRARVNNIQLGRRRQPGFHSCVLVNGTGEWKEQPGKSYLELIDFGDGFVPGWSRQGGGSEDDLRVSYAAFATEKTP